jgi:hypothetical protein
VADSQTVIRKRKVTTFAFLNRCERCKHSWRSTGKKPPRACARCKAMNWNRRARPYRRKK